MRATQLRPGMTIRHEGELYTVHSVEHRTPGNKRAAMATKMRNLRTGSIIDYRFRAEVDIERAIFDEIEHEYLYSDNEGYHFMNTETYEQFHLGDEGRETRDRTYDSGAAVREHRRHSQSGYLGSTLRPARVVGQALLPVLRDATAKAAASIESVLGHSRGSGHEGHARVPVLRHGHAKCRRRFLQQALQRLN